MFVMGFALNTYHSLCRRRCYRIGRRSTYNWQLRRQDRNTSNVDQNTLHLNPDPEFWSDLDPDPENIINFDNFVANTADTSYCMVFQIFLQLLTRGTRGCLYFYKGIDWRTVSGQSWEQGRASVLFKRTQRSLRSFQFFIKERNVFCVLFCSL